MMCFMYKISIKQAGVSQNLRCGLDLGKSHVQYQLEIHLIRVSDGGMFALVLIGILREMRMTWVGSVDSHGPEPPVGPLKRDHLRKVEQCVYIKPLGVSEMCYGCTMNSEKHKFFPFP